MLRVLKNIAALFLILVFTASAVGVSVYQHICNKTRTASFSLYSQAKCNNEAPKTCNNDIKGHSCCHAENHKEEQHAECSYSSCCINDIKTIALEETFIAPEKSKLIVFSIFDIVPRKELIDITSAFAIETTHGKTATLCDTSPSVFIIAYIQTFSLPEDPVNGIS